MMSDSFFEILEGKSTPHIRFDKKNNQYFIKGRSFPENAKRFYQPVMEWLDQYKVIDNSNVHLDIILYYISSSSIIGVLEVIKKFDKINQSGNCSVEVNWYYDEDDEDVLKIGEDFQRITTLKFNMITN
jgi:hypothetical protein